MNDRTDILDYLNGQVIEPPLGWEEDEIVVNFNQSNVQGSLSKRSLTFVNQAAITIIDYINDGLTGGLGITEGMLYKRDVISNNDSETVFSGYLNFRDYVQVSPVEIEVGIIEINSKDNIDALISGVSLSAMLRTETPILTSADLHKVRYVVQDEANTLATVMLLGTTYLFSMQTYQLAKGTAIDIATYLGISAAGVTGIPASTLTKVIQLVSNLAFLALSVIALKRYLEESINALYPLTKDYYGIKPKTVIEKMLGNYGFTLNIDPKAMPEFENLVYLGTGVNTKSNPFSPQDYGYKVSEIFELVLNLFDADLTVVGKNVYIYPRINKFWNKDSGFIIRSTAQESFTYNVEEIASSIVLTFRTDSTDKWTYINNGPNAHEVQTTPSSVINKEATLIKGLDETAFPVALVSRKGDQLSVLEASIKLMAKAGDALLSIFGGKGGFANKIKTRAGLMKISADQFNVPKVGYFMGETLPANHDTIFSCESLYNNYHIRKSMVANNFKEQKMFLPNDFEVPFSFADFKNVVNNSICKSEDGSEAKITSLKWINGEDKAKINGYIRKIYTKNLKEKVI